MKVTDIKPQLKSTGRYSVFIDGKFAFGLSELGLINSGLHVGQEIGREELDQLKDSAKLDKAYQRALGLLARRPRSEWELRDYLRRKSYDSPTAEQILNRLSNAGLVDDLEFARTWVENRRLLKPTSRLRLMLELRQKRIADDIIEQVIDEDTTDDIEVLRELVARKRKQPRYRDDFKLMQYLSRQGYKYDDIKEALGK